MPDFSEKLRRQRPDEPWTWRADWARRRMRGSETATMAVAWLFAVVFSAFSAPLALKLPEALEDGAGAAALLAMFPLASLGMLYWAISSTLRWRRFGRVELELETLPGVIGGELRATVHLGRAVAAPRGFGLRLTCVRRRRRRKSTTESILWQESRRLAPHAVGQGPSGTAVPVAFTIPYEALPSSADFSADRIIWRLQVEAALPGADLSSQFEVPVFKTSESSEEVSQTLGLEADAEAPAHGFNDTGGPLELSADPDILVRTRPGGDLELYFPAGRNRAGALAVSIFTALWLGFTAFAWKAAPVQPLMLAVVLAPFALVGLLLAYLSLAMWLQSVRVRADRRGITVARRMWGRDALTHIPAREIQSLVAQPHGSTNGVARFAVGVKRAGRKAKVVTGDVAEKADAQRIAAALLRAVQRSS